MPAKANFSEVEQGYIRDAMRRGLSAKEISLKLSGRRATTIQKFMDANPIEAPKVAASVPESPSRKVTAATLMVQKSEGGRAGVVIMTRDASAHVDDEPKKSNRQSLKDIVVPIKRD